MPKFVRDTLHIIWDQVGSGYQGFHGVRLQLSPPLPELSSDELFPVARWYFVEKHLGAGFVKRALGGEHFLHQGRLRASENIPNFSLFLNLVAYGIFDRAAVKFRDLLKLVETDRHAKAAVLGQLTRHRKDFWRDRSRVESRSFAKGEADLTRRHVVVDIGLHVPPESRDPILDPIPRTRGAQDLFRKFFQELRVARVAAHRQVNGVDVPLFQLEKRQCDEGAFSETSGGQQKYLLSISQVSDELAEFACPINEIRLLNDLAEDERIFGTRHYAY